jgi:hypothetical protein
VSPESANGFDSKTHASEALTLRKYFEMSMEIGMADCCSSTSIDALLM